MSFDGRTHRSGGTRGATVEALRGNHGASFEGPGTIERTSEGIVFCGCFGGGRGRRSHSKERYLLIKGPFCFVFSDKEASSPKYAVDLQNLHAKLHNSSRRGQVIVQLQTTLGDAEYKIMFASEAEAEEFSAAVDKGSAMALSEATRKRLGHPLLQKRSSWLFAEQIAKTKKCEQPEAPVSTEEAMANLPEVAFWNCEPTV